MPRTLNPWERRPSSISFFELLKPALDAMKEMPELKAKGNRQLKMTFEDQLRALVFFHQIQASNLLPKARAELGDLVGIVTSIFRRK